MHSQFEDPKLDSYFAYLKLKRWRCLFLISGEESFAQSAAQEFHKTRNIKDSLWITDVLQDSKENKQFQSSTKLDKNKNTTQQFCQSFKQLKNFLGQEFSFVFLNVFGGLDANVFCQATGLVKAGGALILICPDISKWAQSESASLAALADYKPPATRNLEPSIALYSSPCSAQFFEDDFSLEKNTSAPVKYNFIQRFIDCFDGSPQGVLCTRNSPLVIQSNDFYAFYNSSLKQGSKGEGVFDGEMDDENNSVVFFHEQQQDAVKMIKRCAQGHAKRPVVIYANRGRGKSAALGISAAQLMQDADQEIKYQIIICAPNIAHVETAFNHAQALLEDSKRDTKKLCWKNSELIFLSCEELLNSTIKPALVLVDEAAMFPVEQLKKLAEAFNRLVFATTVYGYEGSGKGFEQRFLGFLKSQSNCVYQHWIHKAARWNDGDSLESFTHKLCLLEADLARVDYQQLLKISNYLDELNFELLKFKEGGDEDLKQTFALMMHAHYRTNPRDFQALLDVDNLHCFALRYKKDIIALALVKDEGELDAEIAQQIIANKRRVNGHLLAQDLLKQSADNIFARSRGARVMRIMVYPAMQQHGLGSHLLAHIKSYLTEQGYDYWGTSFGAHPELVKFWYKNGFLAFRLGYKKQHSSGDYNCLFAEALKLDLTAPINKLNQHFITQLATQISLNKGYDVALISNFYYQQSLLNIHNFDSVQTLKCESTDSSQLNLNNIQRYINDELTLQHIYYDATKLALIMIKNLKGFDLNNQQTRTLILTFIYDTSIKQLADYFSLQGKMAVEDQLKQVLSAGLTRLSTHE